MSATVILRKGEGRTVKSGGAWIFDNEIDRVEGDFENGDIVEVHDFDGYFLGWGFYNPVSKISVRLMSRRKEHAVTEAFLEQRVRDAWEYRKRVIDTGSCRVIFGEADWLPGEAKWRKRCSVPLRRFPVHMVVAQLQPMNCRKDSI